jgi:hypothetical protein
LFYRLIVAKNARFGKEARERVHFPRIDRWLGLKMMGLCGGRYFCTSCSPEKFAGIFKKMRKGIYRGVISAKD